MVTKVTEFDLRPDPRILPMLGEINLAQWRCLAELVDNSVDGFLSGQRAGTAIANPEVSINLPMRDDPSSQVSITDNGPGMTPEVLERAVSAGWSGNNPVDSLGMFGMGFNIATARLGSVTTVWTSQVGDTEEHGLKIDFAELVKTRHFRTPRLSRPKTSAMTSGTSIVIERLKPDQRSWFAKAPNRSAVKESLSEAYSAMLRENGIPITFKLVLNGKKVAGRSHCVWDDSRQTQTSRFGPVFAVQKIDRTLPNRPFCMACWQWLPATDQTCPSCGTAGSIIQRKRHVHGWVGLQRYLSGNDYGIDFIRNGRKIEIGNRDLFIWRDPTTGSSETEYPIDDPRQRGRFVGEIHLDHARVTYMKDRFDRTDPAWEEMVGIVRGQGPLQPQKAAALGFGANESPLFKLYQAFRRSSPKSRVAGGWADVLVVKENDRAEEMAKKYHEGLADYLLDTKWYELVVEEDNKLLTPPGRPPAPPPGGGTTEGGTGGGNLGGFAGPSGATATGTPGASPAPATLRRKPIASLTREFRHDATGLRWDVRAFEVDATDPELGAASPPWSFRKLPDGTATFLLNRSHPIYRSSTMTDLDALLCELAYKAADFSRSSANPPAFASILADLRDQYGESLKLDGAAILNSTEQLFRLIARTFAIGIVPLEANQLYTEIPSVDREAIQLRMAARSVPNPQQVVADARFLEYAPPRVLVDFIKTHPEHFFDSKCWEDPYATLDFMHPSATEEARKGVLAKYEALLADAVWLSEREAADIDAEMRERVIRASIALELLTPTPSPDRSEQA